MARAALINHRRKAGYPSVKFKKTRIVEFIKEVLLLEKHILIWLLAAFVSLAAIIGALKTLIEFYYSYKQIKSDFPKKHNLLLNRRNFIIASVFFSALPVIVISSKRLINFYKTKKRILHVIHNENLVANKKTGIIHLKNVSTGTLPSTKHSTHKINLHRSIPYSGFERRIYESLGKEALKQRKDDFAIELYNKAIDSSPLSYHLYDKLIRIYGRSKEYSKIRILFETALSNLENSNISKKRYRRAKKEFRARLNRTIFRAEIS